MKKVLLLCHVGLGDAFMCNGLVHTLLDRYKELIMPVIPEYHESIKFMYSEFPGVHLLNLPKWDRHIDDLELRRIHFKYLLTFEDYNVISLGFLNETEHVWLNGRRLDVGFYEQARVPFENKWSNCKLPYSKIQLPVLSGKYAFVHRDTTRGMVFDLPKNLPIVYNTDYYVKNIFEWEDVIRGAAEIHVMDSCFSNWIELMKDIDHIPKFLYDTRHLFGTKGFPMYRANWKLITGLTNTFSAVPLEETKWGLTTIDDNTILPTKS